MNHLCKVATFVFKDRPRMNCRKKRCCGFFEPYFCLNKVDFLFLVLVKCVSLLKQLLKAVRFVSDRCDYRSRGCQQLKTNEHHLTCSFRTIHCPHVDCQKMVQLNLV